MIELAERSGADLLSQLFEEQTEDRLKERVIIALGKLNDAQARVKLREITRNEKTFYLRERALIEMSRWFGADELSRLFDEQTEALFKERILNLLSQSNEKTGLEKLFSVAKGDSSPLLRQTAIRLLGQSKDPVAVKLLEQLI
jgi:HEAT repeat protein